MVHPYVAKDIPLRINARAGAVLEGSVKQDALNEQVLQTLVRHGMDELETVVMPLIP